MAIASLVIGLVLIVGGLQSHLGTFFRIPMLSRLGAGNIYSVPIAIVGLVLGIVAVRKKPQRGLAVTGIALNGVAVLFIVGVIVMWAILGD